MKRNAAALALVALGASWSQAALAEDKVCFYEHPEYQGAEYCYGTGNVGWIGSSRNDRISSIKLYGNAYVDIFQHGSFGGTRTRIMANTYRMDDLDDEISSFKVGVRSSNDYACLFEHPGFRGTPHCLQSGQSEDDLDHVSLRRNKASSVIIGGNARAEVFSYPGFRTDKNHGALTRSSSNLEKRPGQWYEDDIDSWRVVSTGLTSVKSALNINEALAYKIPLRQSNMLGSHNAFNSTAYFGSQVIPGPNHRRALVEQLQLGARVFELDVRRGDGYTRVCHSTDCSFSSARTSLRRMLGEMDSWIKGADEDDFIIIFLQDDMGGDTEGYNQLRRDVEWMGDIVYSPGTCQSIPSDLTVEDLRAQGKRILFYKSGGSSGCNQASNVAINFESNIGVASINVNSNHFNAGSFLRSQECINNFCNDRISASDALTGLTNGVNNFGLDMIEEGTIDNQDGRLNKQLWAIGPEDTYNANSNGRTVRFTTSGDRFMKLTWNTNRAYACRKSDGSWDTTAAVGNVWSGASACSSEFPGSTYDVPLSAYEAKKLRNALNGSDVHVNFGVSSGRWVAGRWGSLGQR